jgi:hypothetical protein
LWAVVHFDPSVTKEQREVIAAILEHVYTPEQGTRSLTLTFHPKPS